MRVATVLIGAVTALLASFAPADAQPFKWWQDEKMKAELALTADQSARIEGVFQSSMATQRKNFDELGRREKEFSEMLLRDDTTEAAVMRQAEQVEALRAEMSKNRTLMLFRMNRILTMEQRMKFNELQERRDRERNRRPPEKPVKK
jgi:Spy/CpxP family protein refolding chaperone